MHALWGIGVRCVVRVTASLCAPLAPAVYRRGCGEASAGWCVAGYVASGVCVGGLRVAVCIAPVVAAQLMCTIACSHIRIASLLVLPNALLASVAVATCRTPPDCSSPCCSLVDLERHPSSSSRSSCCARPGREERGTCAASFAGFGVTRAPLPAYLSGNLGASQRICSSPIQRCDAAERVNGARLLCLASRRTVQSCESGVCLAACRPWKLLGTSLASASRSVARALRHPAIGHVAMAHARGACPGCSSRYRSVAACTRLRPTTICRCVLLVCALRGMCATATVHVRDVIRSCAQPDSVVVEVSAAAGTHVHVQGTAHSWHRSC